MGRDLIGSSRPPSTPKGGLLGLSSESRYNLDRMGSLQMVIVSRKVNATHDIRIDRPSFSKLTEISTSDYLTSGHYQPGMGSPYELMLVPRSEKAMYTRSATSTVPAPNPEVSPLTWILSSTCG